MAEAVNPFLINPFLLPTEEVGGIKEVTKKVGEGYLPAAANIVGDIARSIPAGLAGFGGMLNANVLKGEDPGLKGAEVFEQVFEDIKGATPRFTGPEVEEAEQKIGGVFEKVEEGAKAGGRLLPGALLGGEVRKTLGMDPNIAYESGALGGGIAAELVPLPGAVVIGRGAKLAARAIKRRVSGEPLDAADAAILKQAKDIAAEEGRPVNEVLEELATGKKEVREADLFKEDQPIPVDPQARNPFILDPAERARLEAEMNGPSAEQIAETTRHTYETTGQMDLVDPQVTAGPATPSLRSKVRGPDLTELETPPPGRAAPKLTEQELYGPREKVIEPPETMEFRQPHAADYFGDKIPFDQKLQAITGSGDPLAMRKALEHIRDSRDIPEFLTYFADRLLKDEDFNPKIMVADKLIAEDVNMPVKEGWDVGGYWGWKQGEGSTVVLSKAAGKDGKANTVLHEAGHAKIALFQHMYDHGHTLPRDIREGVEAINHLWEYTKEKGGTALGETHGMSDSKEFFAEGWSNMEFQEALKDIRYTPVRNLIRRVVGDTVYDAFVSSVARILGISPDRINVLSELIKEGSRLMSAIEQHRGFAKMAYSQESIKQASLFKGSVFDTPEVNKAPKRQPKSHQEFMDGLKAEGKPAEFLRKWGKVLYKNYKEEWNKQYGYPKPPVGRDNRPHEDFSKDLYNPDNQMRIDDIKRSWGPFYTESKRHTILNRVYDAVSQAENATNNVYNDLYRGWKIEPGLGVSALRYGNLRESPDSVAALSSRMTKEEIKSFTETVGNLIEKNKTAELIANPERYLGANEAKLVLALKKMGDDSLKLTNETRAKQGVEPIKGRDDWFTSYVRHGKYHIYSLDENGKSTYRKGFESAEEARAVAAVLREEGFTDIRIATAANDPRRVVLPPEAFHEAKKMVETKEQRDLLDKAVEEASLRMGTRKYGMARKSEAGGLPLSKEEIQALGHQATFDNFMFGVKAYANSTARYVGANSDGHAKRVYDLFGDPKINNDYPNAMNAAKQRWRWFQGLDKALEDYSKTVGAVHQGFLQTAVIADNPVFWLANWLQFGFSPARMILENARQLGNKGSVPEAVMRGLARVYIKPDMETKAIVKEAVRNGSLEARFAEALEWRLAEGTSLRRAADIITMQKAAALSDSFSRMATYMMFYELGKSAGISGKKLHQFAAKETQGVMIQYSKVHRMPVINKTGWVGELASPLTSFVSNFGYNVGQYMKTAAVGDKAAARRLLGPILAYLTFQTAVSGMKGLPGYENLDSAISMLNQLYVEKFGGEWFGSPSEWLSETGLNDYVMYGIPSASTGVNMTGTLGFGHVLPSAITEAGDVGKMFPGVGFAGSVLDAALSAVDPSLTEADKARIVSQVAPGVLKEWVKQYLSQEGITGVGKGREIGADKELVYSRSPLENFKSLMSGKPSIAESKVKAAVQLFKRKEASVSSAKKTAVQLFADSVQRGRDMPSYTKRTINNYPELYETIIESTIEELEGRNIPFYQSKMMEALKASGFSGARQAESLQHLFKR